MDPLRGTLLWASGNATLREHLPRFRAVRKTVERFMPGETADDGLAAAERLAADGLPATFTLLGENVDDLSQATAAAGAYLKLLDRIDALGMDAEVSVKLTQLGFDLEPDATMVHMERLADRSAEMGRTLWIVNSSWKQYTMRWVRPRLKAGMMIRDWRRVARATMA